MTTISVADTGPRMGRPTLKAKDPKKKVETVATTIRLTTDLMDRVREVAGNYGMANFFRDAAERELEHRAKLNNDTE